MLRNFYETRKCESPVLSRIFLQEICAKEISRYSNFSLHTSVNTRNILLIQKKNLYVSFSISVIRARWTHNNSLNELRHESILRYEISINAKLTQYFSSVFSFAHFPIFFFFLLIVAQRSAVYLRTGQSGWIEYVPNHVWHVDGVGRCPFSITCHIGEPGEICVLVGQPCAFTRLEQPDLVYTFGQPHRLQQDQRTLVRWGEKFQF